jgi:hypothetical protein
LGVACNQGSASILDKKMKQLLKSALLACVCSFVLAGQAIADPLLNAMLAYYNNDFATAATLLLPLADKGNAEAQYFLGTMYDKGQGVPQDYKAAITWYRLAAKQGVDDAQDAIGKMYDYGRGVSQDYKEAEKWYRLAAEQGDADAQFNLGYLYAQGKGVPQNLNEAVKWNRRAAEQGYADAQANLGLMYGNGQGVTQDYVLAHMWLNIAAANSTNSEQQKELIQRRNLITEVMTPNQLAEAQELARKCTANKFKGC